MPERSVNREACPTLPLACISQESTLSSESLLTLRNMLAAARAAHSTGQRNTASGVPDEARHEASQLPTACQRA